MNDETRISITEAAQLLGVSRASLYLLLGEKKIAHYRPAHGAIYLLRADVEAYRDSCRVEVVLPEKPAKKKGPRSLEPGRALLVETARLRAVERIGGAS